jgi:hypothetical protein
MTVLHLPAEGTVRLRRRFRDEGLYFKLEFVVRSWTMVIHIHINVNVHQIGVLRRRHCRCYCERHCGRRLLSGWFKG